MPSFRIMKTGSHKIVSVALADRQEYEDLEQEETIQEE